MTDPFSSTCCKEQTNVTTVIIIFASILFVSILFKLVADFIVQRLNRDITIQYYFISRLTDAEISELPITRYQRKLSCGTSECTICITELEDGDMVRTLPKCNHVFHRDCIDRWLYISGTCPICRTAVSAGESSINSSSLPSSGTTSASTSEMTSTSALTSPSTLTSLSTSSHSDLDNTV
jgi:Ring finger domain